MWFGPANFLGHKIQLEVHAYQFRGHELEFGVGTPRLSAGGAPSTLAVFVEGDGSFCQRYSRRQWRRFLTRYTGDVTLVRPCTLTNRLCGKPQFAGLDLMGRVEELATVVDAVDRRYPGQALVLIGESAGAHVAALYAHRQPDRVRGIVNLGGGVDSLADVLRVIARSSSGKRAREDAEATIERVAARPDSDELFWRRSYRFWHQLFFLDARRLWLHCPCPALIVHGQRDRTSVPYESVRIARQEFDAAGAQARFLLLPNRGHNLRSAEVFRAVNDWIGSIATSQP
jgi:pimeloyl-ACP methyl ester carboxylesterase